MLPENWDTVALFLDVQTQWRPAPMGGLIGLDYPGVDVALRRGGWDQRSDIAELWWGLQVMERAALEKMGEDQAS